MKDLLGQEITEKQARVLMARKTPQARGYVRPPGSGPKGETCGSCKWLYRNQHAKVYLKCWLNRPKWTGGRASDVLSKAPACEKWEKPDV